MATQPVTQSARLLRLDPKTGAVRERTYALEIMSGAAGTRVYPLTQAVVVGSSPECGLQLKDATVSRQHAELSPRTEGVRVRDLRSTNGTYVRGVRIDDAIVEDEATLTLGNVRVRLRFEDAEVPTSSSSSRFGDALGESPAMRKLFGVLDRISTADTPVVLVGETGTGKDLLARAIARASHRRAQPFEVLDCASLTPELAESDLFGHAKGAFTGASSERNGAFLRANGGTLFLDGVGELPLELQTRLLRALSDGTVRRVGEDVVRAVDVRVIASTHEDLEAAVSTGSFRRDLYYRLAVAMVSVPPLRERPEDIPLLANHYWKQLGRAAALPPAFVRLLASYRWPGNVRELRNVIERAATLYPEDDSLERLDAQRFRAELLQNAATVETVKRDPTERDRIVEALQRCAGNQSEAAKLLGISRGTLLSRLDAHGIPRPRKNKASDE